jgi:DNA-binding transcriptional ArsR family regulator
MAPPSISDGNELQSASTRAAGQHREPPTTETGASYAPARAIGLARLLVQEAAIAMAGDIATALQVPPATLSFHLKELVQAGLVESESQGRHVCYRANFDAMNGLIST